jgi:hypothetical protein
MFVHDATFVEDALGRRWARVANTVFRYDWHGWLVRFAEP